MSHAAGFRETRLPRQGKQPPELALTLDNSETATSNVLHTLTLLQSPHSTHNPSPAPPSQGQRQQSVARLQQHSSQGNTSAEESQGPQPLGSGQGELLSADDMQVTDDTAMPAVPAEVETAAGAGTGARQLLFLKHLWHIVTQDRYQKFNQTFQLLLKVGAAIQSLILLG